MKSRAVVGVVACLLVLGACTGNEDSGQGTDQPGGSENGETVLIIADSATPSTLDPDFATTDQSWAVGQNAYRHFVEQPIKPFEGDATEVDLEAEPVGALAESYEASEDGMTYTFHLREGVMSPYGNELTTADVQWSWDRTLAIEALGPFVFDLGSIDTENPLTILDERTFEVHLTAPTPVFLRVIAIPLFASPIFDSTEAKKHATEEEPWALDWLGTHTAGFGPYHAESFTAGEEVVWVENPNYYEGDLEVDRVIQREVPSESTRLALLKAGEVDIAAFLGPHALEDAASTDGVNVLSVQGNLGLMFGLNNESPPFDDVQVRRAVAHAMPIEEITQNVYAGNEFAVDFEGYAPITYPFAHEGPFDYWPYDHDPDKARQMIEAAGAAGSEVTLTINAARPDHEQVAIVVRDALADVGLDITIDKLSPARYQEQYFNREAQMVIVQDAPWVVDPAYVTVNYFHPEAGIANWVNYSDPEGARLMQTAYDEGDPDRRFDLAGEAYQKVVDDAPWAAYIGTGFHLAVRDDVGGFVWRTDNLMDFKYFYKTG
jgi:peptide/nickel transport system substrate-binding protein